MRAKNRQAEAAWLRKKIRTREKVEAFGFGPYAGRLSYADSGRATSSGPSLQNVPFRTAQAKELHAKFHAAWPELRATWFKSKEPAPDTVAPCDYTQVDLFDFAAAERRILSEIERLVGEVWKPLPGYELVEALPGVYDYVKGGER